MITVFISHSAVGDDVARSVCEAIEHNLKDNHYDVYYDARHEPGQRWRSTVYRSFNASNAGPRSRPASQCSGWSKTISPCTNGWPRLYNPWPPSMVNHPC